MTGVTEKECLSVAAARAGEADAWDTLFRRFQLPLYSYVCELVRDEQVSLDIVQETFINAARHLGSLREDGKFASWLFGIAHQKCVQRWRRRQPEPTSIEDLAGDPPGGDPGPSEWLLRKEQEEIFLDCLDQLSAEHRAVLLLHFLEEFSLEEIAAITETGLGTVKSRMHYAKKALRQLLEEQP
jgi:RNA polymerase sigma-70 factor (ECF subfamily)